MNNRPKYFIVEASLLPEVFLKVVEANKYLQSGKAKTVNDATTRVGISRSAFYKYRDGVRPFYEMITDRIITFHILVSDEPGILSTLLSLFARFGANILTINQNIPINGQAGITISARTGEMRASVEHLINKALEIPGVIKFEILASE